VVQKVKEIFYTGWEDEENSSDKIKPSFNYKAFNNTKKIEENLKNSSDYRQIDYKPPGGDYKATTINMYVL
jgi:hypothetical protein